MHINYLVERFLREQSLPPTRFGRLAANDPRLVFDMRLGRALGTDLEQRLRRFMVTYRSVEDAGERRAA